MLINYFKYEALTELVTGAGEYRPDRPGRMAVLSYHLADIIFGDSQFKYGRFGPTDLSDRNVIRVIDEQLCHHFYQFFHRNLLLVEAFTLYSLLHDRVQIVEEERNTDIF
jgi:hypothetical protein